LACGDDDALPGDSGTGDANGIDAGRTDSGPGPDARSVDAASRADARSATGETGEPCATEADCVAPNTVCLLEAEGSGWDVFPDGHCTLTPCTFGEACGMGGICAPLPGHGPHCFVACERDGDCRAGYTCQESTFVTGSLCLPPMT
jgi:hypothetical protein